MVGDGITVKTRRAGGCAARVVTLIGPVVAPAGTVTVMVVAFTTV